MFLDLDGTLVDSAPGIIRSYEATLRAFGVAGFDREQLRGLIGPPLRATLGRLLGDGGRVGDAVAFYRERYGAEGLLQARVYPGIDALLAAVRQSGASAYVCTSKLTTFAVRVAGHFGLDASLDGIFGAEADGRFDRKADLVAHILGAAALQPHQVVMIGDRREDILAARENGVTAIGALWGYGGEAELAAAGAEHLCASPGDLQSLLQRL